MFGYVIARWRFKRAFKPDGEEFLFRKNSRAPAYRVSREERKTFLRNFTRKYWKYHLIIMGGFIGALIAIIFLIIMLWGDAPEEVVTWLASGFAGVLLVAILLIDRRLYAQPLETLGDREPAFPARSWCQANADLRKSMSWPVLVIWSLVLIGLAWLTFPQGDFELWWPIIWTLYFCIASFSWVRAILKKLNAPKIQ